MCLQPAQFIRRLTRTNKIAHCAGAREGGEGSGCCCTLMISTTQHTHNLLSAVVFVDKSDLTSTIFFVSANRRPFAGAIVKNLCTLCRSRESEWKERQEISLTLNATTSTAAVSVLEGATWPGLSISVYIVSRANERERTLFHFMLNNANLSNFSVTRGSQVVANAAAYVHANIFP